MTIITLLLASISTAAAVDQEDLVTRGFVAHTFLLPKVSIAPIPWTRNDYCLFSLVTHTDAGPVVMSSFRVDSGKENALHNISDGKRTLPSTANSYTWESIVLLRDSAVLRIETPEQIAKVEIAMISPGVCVVQSPIKEEK
jgi:hypothetical protein